MKHSVITMLFLIFGCTFQSKQQTNKIDNSETQISEQSVNYDTLRFDLNPDIRLFTAMAFANISGYDYENTVMSSERLEMRNYLDSILSDSYKERIRGTNKSTNSMMGFTIGSKAFNLSLPPNFKWLPDTATLILPYFVRDEEFAILLNEFYSEANIPALWSKFYPKLHKTNHEYAPYTDKAIEDIIKFCRIDKDHFNLIKFHFNVCPFMQNESGFTCSSKSDIYIIVSPRKTLPGPDAFYHEALHHIINPLVDKNKFALQKYSQVANIGKESRASVYFHIDGLFSECLVRAIDYILREEYYNWDKEQIKEEINRQFGYGLTLIPYFYEKLSVFKETSETLEECIPELIKQIDIEKEKIRWTNFNVEKDKSRN